MFNTNQRYSKKQDIWNDAELLVMKNNAGKIHIDEIVILVNEVSDKGVVRIKSKVIEKGNSQGCKFKIKKAA